MARAKIYDAGSWRYATSPVSGAVTGRLKVWDGASWDYVVPVGSDTRLSGVKDGPTDIALGTLGDEFEYMDASAFTAVWTPTNSLTDYTVMGSAIRYCSGSTSGRGFYRALGSNLPDEFEIAVLLSGLNGTSNMVGIAALNSSGNGIGCSAYTPNAYTWTIASYAYSATRSGGTNQTAAQAHSPNWIALRASSAQKAWRFRWSTDGTTWTTPVASDGYTGTNLDRIFVGSMYNGANDYNDVLIHRVVYGTPDLGLG